MSKINENKPGYKNTKVGWIPDEWEVKILNNIGTHDKPVIKAGPFGSALKKEFYVSKGYKVYGQEQVIQNDAFVGDYYIDEKKFNSLKSCMVTPGDILLSLVGTIGKTLIVPESAEEGIINPRLLRLSIDRNKYSSNFLAEYLKFEKTSQLLERWSQGGTMGVLNASILRAISIPLPPLPEQQKIAEILSTWDRAIEKNEALIDQLKLRKKGLMQQLLTGKKRLRGFSDEWKEVKLGDIFSEIRTKNDGNLHEPLTISARLGFVSQKDKFDRVIAGSSIDKYILLEKGDFAYNKGNSKLYEMGCIYLLEEFQSAIVPFVYISFRKKIENVDNNFYKYWFQNHGLDRQLKAIITSGARGDGLLNVNKKDFFSLVVPCPMLEEQKAIAKVLTAADNEIKEQEKYLNQLKDQKKGLMQQLLTGQKRVNVNN
ncbi:restriction endonuclease subunit S [Puteibacter caeruleilacunae]|nr:restriction endonuclease subunit S [Puteibacter caeruleilacunae]